MSVIELIFYSSVVVLWFLMLGLALSLNRMQRVLAGIRHAQEKRDANGPPPGLVAPPLEGEDLRSSGFDRAAVGQPTVVLFMGAHCGPCKAVLRAVNSLAEEFSGRIQTVISCVGGEEEVTKFGSGLISSIALIADPMRKNAQSWQVYLTPFAVIVDGSGIVQGNIARVSGEQIRLAIDSVLIRESQAV